MRAIADVIASFGTVEKLCEYWGWEVRPRSKRRPRIFYGTMAGNKEQAGLYRAIFEDLYPYVYRLSVVDPMVNIDGTPRNLTFGTNAPELKRFSKKLRRVVFDPPPTPLQSTDSETIKERFGRPGKKWMFPNFAIEEYQRAQIAKGFKSKKGKWEMRNDDIVIIADADEVPLREVLVGMTLCLF